MQDFKKILKASKNIIFFLILFVIIIVLSERLDKTAKANDYLIHPRNKSIVQIQKESENSIDVLVIGDSESYSSFSPLEMWSSHGFTSYICGQPGQKIQESYYMLKTALNNQSPKLVVLETNVLFHSPAGTNGLQESVIQTRNYYFPVFRYHDIWKPILLEKRYDKEDYKGFLIRDSITSYEGKDYMAETKGKADISAAAKDNLNLIAELCSENNAKLILVSVPSPVNYNYKKHNAIAEYAEKNSLEYLDLNLKTKELDINWKTDSIDKGDHLNLLGAQKVTAYFGDYLKDNHDLPDHRDDILYQNWNNMVNEYDIKIKEKMMTMQK